MPRPSNAKTATDDGANATGHGYAIWLDIAARPVIRLPESVEDALEYVSRALGSTVYTEWTPRTLVQRFGCPGEAKLQMPEIFQLLLHNDRVIQYWNAGQLVAVPAGNAPARDVVLNRLLRTLRTRFRHIESQNTSTTESGSPHRISRIVRRARTLDYGAWLTRSGRFFNADSTTNTLGVVDDAAATVAFLRDRASRSPETRRTYIHEIHRLVAWAQSVGLGPLSDLSRDALLAYRDALPGIRSAGRVGAPTLSAHTVIRALAVVKSLFSYWAATGYIKVNPASALGNAKSDRNRFQPERFLPVSAMRAVDAWLGSVTDSPIKTLRQASVLALYRYAGVRVAELGWSREFHLPRITVDQSGGWTLEVIGKGSRRRAVPLPFACISVLRRYRLARGLSEVPTPFDNAVLIHGERGAGLGKSGLYRVVKQAMADIAKNVHDEDARSLVMLHLASPHWLRHSYARTMVVEHRVPLPVVQRILGHASVTTTAGYAISDLSELRSFVEAAFDRAPAN
jgi:integrase/recombinase XerC